MEAMFVVFSFNCQWAFFFTLYTHLDYCIGKEIPDDGYAQRLMLYAGADHVFQKV